MIKKDEKGDNPLGLEGRPDHSLVPTHGGLVRRRGRGSRDHCTWMPHPDRIGGDPVGRSQRTVELAMKVDVYFRAGEPAALDMVERTVVVIDVLRATSTMVEALVNGARGVYPAASTEEAIKLASSLGRDDTLLCGERKGLMVDGFDLGNSPREFSAKTVAAADGLPAPVRPHVRAGRGQGFEMYRPTWKNAKYAAQWRASLSTPRTCSLSRTGRSVVGGRSPYYRTRSPRISTRER